MNLVGAGLGRHQNRGPGALSILGRVVVGKDLEFLNVVDGRENSDPAFVELIVIVAVEQPVGALFARSANREREGTAGGSFATGGAVEETVGIGRLSRARGEGRELDEIATIQREVGYFFGSDERRGG